MPLPAPSLPAPNAPPSVPLRGAGSWLARLGALAVIGAAAWLTGGAPLAVCAVSFWHYGLYALAYRYGAVPLPDFKRDAVAHKSVALAALAAVYLAAPLDFASLAVVAAGFGLNALAAAALGSDRTYYGREVADLPPLRVTRFPYSALAHPMLVGNMLAFGGTLLNAEFRGEWWPLAAAHVALNFLLLLMERCVTPLRLGAANRRQPVLRPTALAVAAGAALGAAAALAGGAGAALPAAALGAGAFGYGVFLFRGYVPPRNQGEQA